MKPQGHGYCVPDVAGQIDPYALDMLPQHPVIEVVSAEEYRPGWIPAPFVYRFTYPYPLDERLVARLGLVAT